MTPRPGPPAHHHGDAPHENDHGENPRETRPHTTTTHLEETG